MKPCCLDTLVVGALTVAEPEALCTANNNNFTSSCLGFTFASNSTRPAAPVTVYLKDRR